MESLRPFTVRLNDSEMRRHLMGDEPSTAGFRSGQVILQPGESIGEHATRNKEEVIVIFEGRAEISSERGPSLIADKESVSYIPPETKHNVKNVGSTVLRYIYLVSPVKG